METLYTCLSNEVCTNCTDIAALGIFFYVATDLNKAIIRHKGKASRDTCLQNEMLMVSGTVPCAKSKQHTITLSGLV